MSEAQKLLDKAGRSIRAAERLMEEGLFEFAAGRAYYAMFYVAEAILATKGLRYAKHGGVHAAFGEHVVKPGEMDRGITDGCWTPSTGASPPTTVWTSRSRRRRTTRMIEQAKEFLEAGRRYLESRG